MVTPYWSNGVATLFHADAREIPLPDQSVHCVVTSPPYFGLRVYRSNSDAMIGLESTVQGWLDSMMAVMDEVKRVLRDDGSFWCNLGDSYDGGQLLGIPWRFALAMQDAGWILRSDCIWAKKSPMPESLNGTRWERCQTRTWGDPVSNTELRRDRQNGRDFGTPTVADCPGCDKCQSSGGYVLRNGSWRCTSSHEHIFQFVKGMGYYSDGEAVKAVSGGYHNSSFTTGKTGVNGLGRVSELPRMESSGANRRNVWNDIKPEPYGGEHYATFPPDLPRICIQASTSEAGACSKCASQYARVVDPPTGGSTGASWHDHADDGIGQSQKHTGGALMKDYQAARTLSWRPTCTCNAAKVGATVLDPFAGTGTTLLAAMRLGRRSYGTDLSEDYLKQAIKRLSTQSLPMEL